MPLKRPKPLQLALLKDGGGGGGAVYEEMGQNCTDCTMESVKSSQRPHSDWRAAPGHVFIVKA